MSVDLKELPYDDPVAQHLVDAIQEDLRVRYGNGDESPVSAADFAPPYGAFLVASIAGEPVGCGGWRSRSAEVAEVKRMYTAPAARGRGVARAVLAALEASARSAGKRRMILETGTGQPEAIAFYQACGYRRIPNYGFYKDDPGCVSFGRDL